MYLVSPRATHVGGEHMHEESRANYAVSGKTGQRPPSATELSI